MPVPDQMYKDYLTPRKGWDKIHALTYDAPVKSGVTIKKGMACSLDANGELVLGVFGTAMGLFAFRSGADLDVDASGGTEWQPAFPRGKVTCFVATCGMELETTAFDSAQTYSYNNLLRAPSSTGRLTNQSVVTAANSSNPSSNATAVCGVVSGPVYVNKLGVSVLPFWPVWYPGRNGET